MKISFDVRRLWCCPNCGYQAKLPGNRVARQCPSCTDVVWLQLVEKQRIQKVYSVPHATDIDFEEDETADTPSAEAGDEVAAAECSATEIDASDQSTAELEDVDETIVEAVVETVIATESSALAAVEEPVVDAATEPPAIAPDLPSKTQHIEEQAKTRKKRSRRRRRRGNAPPTGESPPADDHPQPQPEAATSPPADEPAGESSLPADEGTSADQPRQARDDAFGDGVF